MKNSTVLSFSSIRYNPLNIKLLPLSIFDQFLHPTKRIPPPNEQFIDLAKSHLKLHDIPFDKENNTEPDLLKEQLMSELKLPKIYSSKSSILGIKNMKRHFEVIGKTLSKDIFERTQKFSQVKIPQKPRKEQWLQTQGWTRYSVNPKNCDDFLIKSVPYPDPTEDLVFDVEVALNCPENRRLLPIMATAVSSKSWYAWVSPFLFDSTIVSDSHHFLIPMGPNADENRILVGHCVSYDRSKIYEEYFLKDPYSDQYRKPFNFVDTLSLHSTIGGLSGQQRPFWKKFMASGEESCSLETDIWMSHGSTNSLKDIMKLYCDIEIDKTDRDLMLKATLEDIQKDFSIYMDYCSRDVKYTFQVFQTIWPKFLKKCPSYLTFFGMLTMGTCYLPTDSQWFEFISTCNKQIEEMKIFIESKLGFLIEETVSTYQPGDKWKQDPWLKNLDWTPIPARFTKEEKKRCKKTDTETVIKPSKPIGNSKLFGKPQWYKNLYDNKTEQLIVSSRLQLLPYLLRISYEEKPIIFVDKFGWCVEADNSKNTCDNPIRYIKLPHPETADANVGNVLTKSFRSLFDSGIMTSSLELTKDILRVNSMCSFWISYQSRASNQLCVSANGSLGFEARDSHYKPAVILPHLVPMGTVTRRAVEGLWLTSSNSNPELIGSELKSKIKAPKGYCFVGADVDSEELWLASLFGDSLFKCHGASAISWMTLLGKKADGTDLHSRTAAILGVDRGKAKVFNYSRIYGSGLSFASSLLRKYDPHLTQEEADKKSRELYKRTKGIRVRSYFQKDQYPHLADHLGNLPVQGENVTVKLNRGGSESYLFNELERRARCTQPSLPVSGTIISDALATEHVQGQFMTSRINWLVQSSAVDYLHMLLTSIQFLCKKRGIFCRLVLSIHDELRYMVRDEDALIFGLILQIANLWTRITFSQCLGLYDLPESVAWFSTVDVDTVLRKEVDLSCVTPSQPNPIPPGRSYDIYALLKEAKMQNISLDFDNDHDIDKAALDIEHKLPKIIQSNVNLNEKDMRHWIEMQDVYTKDMISRKSSISFQPKLSDVHYPFEIKNFKAFKKDTLEKNEFGDDIKPKRKYS